MPGSDAGAEPAGVVGGDSGIDVRQDRGRHAAQAGDELGRIQWLTESRLVGVEVGGQVDVRGVAPAHCPDHPDVPAPDRFAQRRQHAQFVRDPRRPVPWAGTVLAELSDRTTGDVAMRKAVLRLM